MMLGLFPGQGLPAQIVADALSAGHERVDEASEVLGLDIVAATRRATRGSAANSLPTDIAQPGIFVAGIVAYERACAEGARFDRLVGHSLGEYTALVAAKAMSFHDGLRVVATRARAMKRAALASHGGMAAVAGVGPETVTAICAEHGVFVANDNTPEQIVLAGPEGALAAAAETVNRAGGRSVLLPVDGAFHTPAMAPAEPILQNALESIDIRSPRIEVIANVTAARYRSPGEIRKLLVRQLTATVRFRESILQALEGSSSEFVDLGPGRVVGRLAAKTVASREVAHV